MRVRSSRGPRIARRTISTASWCAVTNQINRGARHPDSPGAVTCNYAGTPASRCNDVAPENGNY